MPIAYPLSAIRRVSLPHHPAENGDLVVMEALSQVPFMIARVFVVRAPAGAIRGQHAHRQCTQFLTCSSGSIEVSCDDGRETATFVLERPDSGLLVPPGIWAQEVYLAGGSVLTVLCDRPYEPHDYIRDYAEFKAYRSAGGNT